MLKERLATKLNRKVATFLAVPCLLVMVLFYSLTAGFSSGTSAPTAMNSTSQTTVAQSVTVNPSGADESQSEPAAGSGFDMAMDVILKLVVVVGLIFGLTKVLQYVNGRSHLRSGGRNAINVVESLNLAQNQVLYLIEVGEKALLVGATGTQLSTLTEITDPAVVADLRGRVEIKTAPRDSFARYLQRVNGGLQSQSQSLPAAMATMSKLREATKAVRAITTQSKRTTSFVATEDPSAALH